MTQFDLDTSRSLGRRGTHHNNPAKQKVLDILHQEEKKRLHVYLPASLHKTLKLRAVEQDRDMTSIVIESLKAYLGKQFA